VIILVCAARYPNDLPPAQQPDQEKPAPRVSAVVVSHDRAALLRRCLQSLEASEGRDTLQVIVIDNGTYVCSAEWDTEFPRVQFVRLPKNFGQTKAMNIGWRAADAPYVLFLHDDTAVEPSAISQLADLLDANSEAAAVCPLLVDSEGRPAPQLGSLPPDGNWRPAETSGEAPIPVEYPRGAALMMRVFLIKAIRQIDEHYGQFGGDADLAAQILKAGKKILLVPTARARHEGSAGYTSAQRADFLLGRVVFLQKYRGTGAGLQARMGAIVGSLLGFRIAEFRNTLAGQKIDGTQP
jgi:N-acetylglucosaminyl-diphospho-decaprenol L-rhamnosyltransferase